MRDKMSEVKRPKVMPIPHPDDKFLDVTFRPSRVQIGNLKALTIKKNVRKNMSKEEFFSTVSKEDRMRMKAVAFDYLIRQMREENDEQTRAMYEYIEDIVFDKRDFYDRERAKRAALIKQRKREAAAAAVAAAAALSSDDDDDDDNDEEEEEGENNKDSEVEVIEDEL